MKLTILENIDMLAKEASRQCAQVLNEKINEKESAVLVLSTGASQIRFLQHLIQEEVEWNKVEMYHLDEYVGLSEQHPASFRKYLKERFVEQVSLKKVCYVNGEGDVQSNVRSLNDSMENITIDLALIGIGENSHIAFNDPPADFQVEDPYIVVNLDQMCKEQQVREGWFDRLEDVPDQAITMSVKQMMQSECIVSFVPYKVKAHAVKKTLGQEVSTPIPATVLKNHKNWTLYLDKESSSQINGILF